MAQHNGLGIVVFLLLIWVFVKPDGSNNWAWGLSLLAVGVMSEMASELAKTKRRLDVIEAKLGIPNQQQHNTIHVTA